VRYDSAVEKAIAFTFGSTLICADPAAAKAVTYSREVGVRSVTLDGDVYEPGGTLSGGAAPQGAGVLVRMQELNAADRDLREKEGRLQEVERGAERERGRSEAWRRMVKELEMKEHELRLLQAQVEGSNAARVRFVYFFHV
jgi:structural maintenance of chromosome 2